MDREEPRAPGPGARRPLPDPLAGADAGPLRRDLEGVRTDPRRGPRAHDRRLQLTNRGPGPARPRDGGLAGRQPGRAAPAVPPGGTARLARRAWSHNRGLEPARPGSPAG